LPAYDLIQLDRYLIGSLQFSSGCPYRCEFCDIPALYGRQPRLKTPQQIIAELDAMLAQRGHPSVVYFVDDNFIGNRKAAREILPHLINWQRELRLISLLSNSLAKRCAANRTRHFTLRMACSHGIYTRRCACAWQSIMKTHCALLTSSHP
jgi:radical SAM superfamily enzyme YgiQ (UPF0313 family)